MLGMTTAQNTLCVSLFVVPPSDVRVAAPTTSAPSLLSEAIS